MNRICLKCGHANAAATGSELEACPACGAIYSRVEAAAEQRGAQAVRPAPVAAAPARPSFAAATPSVLRGTGTDGPFLDQLRADSNYPTFRSVIGLFALVGYIIAALVAAGAVFSIVKVNLGAGLLGLAFALFIVIMTRMGKEMSLMVADASDALVRMAARQSGA